MDNLQTLADTRAQIAELQRERASVADAALSEAETKNAILAQAEQLAAAGEERIAHHVRRVAHGGTFTDGFVLQTGRTGLVDVGPLLASLIGPARFAEALGHHLEGVAFGLPRAERASRVAELDAQLLALEIAEERVIERIEAAGASVARRGDANPAAVLSVPA